MGPRDNRRCSQPISPAFPPPAPQSCSGWGREGSRSLTGGTELISQGLHQPGGGRAGPQEEPAPSPGASWAPASAGKLSWGRCLRMTRPRSRPGPGSSQRPAVALTPTPLAWPLQTKTWKLDTWPPKLLWEPREWGSGESPHGHRPVASQQAGLLSCPVLGVRMDHRSSSPPGCSHPAGSCWMVKGAEKDVPLKETTKDPLGALSELRGGTSSPAGAPSDL